MKVDSCSLCGSRPEWCNVLVEVYCPGSCALGGKRFTRKAWNALHEAIREGEHWEACPKCDGSGKAPLDVCRCGTGYGSRTLVHPDECVCEPGACERCDGKGAVEHEAVTL